MFDAKGAIVGSHQLEHKQYYPSPGMVEHDAEEIWECAKKTIEITLAKTNLKADDIETIGITNQRETTVIWNKNTGQPYHRAIVWNDTRTQDICHRLSHTHGINRFRPITGLPIAPYFSATKIMYLLDEVSHLREAAQKGEALFGTVDSYLLWKLTGGRVHATDVTNASRTLLMDLKSLQWSEELLQVMDIPIRILPTILPSSDALRYGQICETALSVLSGVRITGVLGDQQAALFGQGGFDRGDAKCTYGTGGFLLLNTGENIVPSNCGLITTVAFQLSSSHSAHYALEGAVAYCGSSIQWLRDNLQVLNQAQDSETLAHSVSDNGGVYFVPAFSGLLCPHWRDDARGAIVGLSAFNTKAHITRAALEATGFQTCEVLEAMRWDSDLSLRSLRVDGGMCKNSFLMQFISDIEGVPLVSPVQCETTAFGAALVAGLAVGFWDGLEEAQRVVDSIESRRWSPQMSSSLRHDLVSSVLDNTLSVVMT